MLRLTWVLLVEAIMLTTLATVLLLHPTPTTVKVAGGVLGAFALFVTVMMLGQERLLKPFVTNVGVCELCAKKK